MASTKFSTLLARVSVTNAVLVAFLSQQIAFAAPGASASAAPKSPASVPLTLATTPPQGVAVIRNAESRGVAFYFQNGGSPAEIKRFNKDLDSLAKANAIAGIADDLVGYQAWWQANQTSVIMQRSKMASTNLQGLFIESYMAFKAEEAMKKNDPESWSQWLQNLISALSMKNISTTSLVVAIAVGTAVGRTIHGAIIAGPMAGMVGAYLDPIVKAFKEKFEIWGGRNWGWAGAGLTRFLNRAPKAKKLTAKQIEDLRSGVGEAEDGQAKTYELLDRMGLEMGPEAFAANVTNMREIWNQTNRSWKSYTISSYKDGRSLISDALSFRPFLFSGQIMTALNGAVLRRSEIRHLTNYIIARQGTDMKQTDALVKSLIMAIAERDRSDQTDKRSAQATVDDVSRSLIALGATTEQVAELVDLRSAELAMVRHASSVLAASVIHDFHYEEFNRSLPEEAKKIYGELRSGYCIDYFHREFSAQTAQLLNGMNFQIQSAKADAAAGAVAPSQLKLELDKAVEVEPETRTERALDFVRAKVRTTTAKLKRIAKPRPEPRMCSDIFSH